jgi:predicted amidophosphoribosyltransferase
LGEYTARRGFSYSPTNQLINNLKKKPHSASSRELQYKNLAINEIGLAFRKTLASEVNVEKLRASTLVPIPPSAISSDTRYDDRMLRVLDRMGAGLGLDIRELVKQYRSVPPAHECDARPSPQEIAENYYIDEDLSSPDPKIVWIFDDVLTAGSHYRAMKMVLRVRFPAISIAGFFVARRVPEADDPGGLIDLSASA